MTPSTSGRRTPGTALPTARSRSATATQPLITPVRLPTATTSITPGSRASKYVGMTAKQLSTRTTGSSSPVRGSNERLQARLDALEDENRRLMTDASNAEGSLSSLSGRLDSLTREQDTAAARITDLEFSLRTAERTVGERDSTIESLERSVQQSVLDVEKVRSEGEARARDIQSKLDDKEALVIQLKEIVEAKEGLESENDAVLSVKNTEISLLESRVQKAYIELEEERRELGAQVDELRKAGQETIALYEERLSAADGRRYELEDLISSLEEQLRMQARPQSPASMARKASSAMEIDNEALREQVQHLHKKIASLEDALEEAHLTSEREEAAIHEKVAHYKEREESMRGELSDSEKEMERVMKSEESARLRIEEIEEALRENTVALENARAEIEGLRAEIANLESIAAGGPQKAPNRSAAQTTGAYELLKAEKSELEHICKQRDEQLAEEREASAVLRQALDERIAELDATRKKLNRELPVNGLQDPSKPSVPPSPSKHDLATAREEIKGLKHIVQELQMENTNLAQRYKVLESENKLLMSETEQLREDMKQLEDNIEQSLLREEEALQAEEDAAIMAELDQLRKRLSDLEMKHARTVHDLNKEIGELESLIESKIYREDELEREVERLKERSARSQKKSSKGLPEEIRAPTSVASSASKMSQYSDSTEHGGGEVCEICERPGHDIFTCDLLNDDRPLSIGSSSGLSDTKQDLYCEDCESRGHTAANCPHSLDVF
ncbi:hypothetical protein EW026_g2495 [Hermanssonia centrifuga]|uniref:Uncharacterized protein n=1 Tax=Hermanssonia centrifuga TaxID=98765 RepID=A0A4S4KNP8_9APHY|nr:hypothetical protein EW026_g2495 [Hermanssonia centrifuga]